MNELVKVALQQYGVKEMEGLNHSSTILQYAKESGFSWVNDDETPWCSIFMNWCAKQVGLERTKKANARSWLEVGETVTNPEMGDIVIFRRGTSPIQGHVAIYIKPNGKDFVYVLGGNQGNMVSISSYPAQSIIGYRRLRKAV